MKYKFRRIIISTILLSSCDNFTTSSVEATPKDTQENIMPTVELKEENKRYVVTSEESIDISNYLNFSGASASEFQYVLVSTTSSSAQIKGSIITQQSVGLATINISHPKFVAKYGNDFVQMTFYVYFVSSTIYSDTYSGGFISQGTHKDEPANTINLSFGDDNTYVLKVGAGTWFDSSDNPININEQIYNGNYIEVKGDKNNVAIMPQYYFYYALNDKDSKNKIFNVTIDYEKGFHFSFSKIPLGDNKFFNADLYKDKNEESSNT